MDFFTPENFFFIPVWGDDDDEKVELDLTADAHLIADHANSLVMPEITRLKENNKDLAWCNIDYRMENMRLRALLEAHKIRVE